MANEIYHRSNWGNAVNDIAWGDTYEKFDATNEMFVRSDNYENSNETDKLMAAINPKPSILLTPTAYDNGSLHSVKPVKTFGSELVPSIATIVNAGGGSITQISQNSYSSISDGTSPSIVRPKFDFATTSGKTYKLVITPIGTITGTVNFDFYDGSTYLFQNYDFTTTKEITFTDNGTVFGAFDGTQTYNISNFTISIKEVTEADFDFTRGSSAARVNEQGLIEDVQILSGELVQNGDFEQIGGELVTNGDFDTDSDWTLGNGWIISGGKAILVDGLDPTYQIYQSISGLNTKNLKVTFDVTDFSGDAELRYPFRENITGNGSYTFYGVGTLDRVQFQVKSGFTASFSIDNVSVKEVGQNWSLTQATIEDGKLLLSTTDGSYTAATQTLGTIGNLYKVSLNVSNIVGTISVAIGGGTDVNITTNGTHIFEITSASTTLEVKRKFGITNVSATIDNISLIEITDDTDYQE